MNPLLPAHDLAARITGHEPAIILDTRSRPRAHGRRHACLASGIPGAVHADLQKEPG